MRGRPGSPPIRGRGGFTVVEILIAAAIFAGFMTGVMMIFRSGSSSFIIGAWKTNAQKKAQVFLAMFKDDIERANFPYRVASSTNVQVATTPIYFANGAYDATGAAPRSLNVSGPAWQLVALMNHTRPQVMPSVYDNGALGKWTGIAVWARNGDLLYVRSGNPVEFSTVPANIPGMLTWQPGGVAVGAPFEPATERLFRTTLVDDVDSISIQRQRRNDEVVVEIRVALVRRQNGQRTETDFTETTQAKPQMVDPAAMVGF